MVDHVRELALPEQNLFDRYAFLYQTEELQNSHLSILLTLATRNLGAEFLDVLQRNLVHAGSEAEYSGVYLSVSSFDKLFLTKHTDRIQEGEP